MDDKTLQELLAAQQGELDAVYLYNQLSKKVKLQKDKDVFKQLAREEGGHAQVFHKLTNVVLKPKKTLGNLVSILRLFVTRKFLYKTIANSEYGASKNYEKFLAEFPEIDSVKNDESRHGDIVLALLNNTK